MLGGGFCSAQERSASLRGLYHGRIAHGEQFMNASRRREPTGYYGLNSGLGEAIKTQRRVSRDRLRIGVIGLGTGTIVAHARKGEEVRYYEIDPDVVAVANEHFFYLADAHSEMTIVLGDARISLEREARPRRLTRIRRTCSWMLSAAGVSPHIF